MSVFFYSSSFSLRVSHISCRRRGEQDLLSVKHSGNVKYFAYLQPVTKHNSMTYTEVRELKNHVQEGQLATVLKYRHELVFLGVQPAPQICPWQHKPALTSSIAKVWMRWDLRKRRWCSLSWNAWVCSRVCNWKGKLQLQKGKDRWRIFHRMEV